MLTTSFSLFSFLSVVACNSGTEVKIGTTNSPPSVTILSPLPEEEDGTVVFDEYSVIHFHAQVYDSYDSPQDLMLLWSTDNSDQVDGLESEAIPDTQGELFYSTAALVPGLHNVTLTVTDSNGAFTQDSVKIEILDQPEAPQIEILKPTADDSGIENEPFTMIVEVFDVFDEVTSLPVLMSSSIDGEICQTNPSASGRAECDANLSAGLHSIEFTVSNSHGYTASDVAEFFVISGDDIDDDSDGYTENEGDCNDNDPTVNPTAPEVENALDDNCNGVTDEGTNAYDDDGDGFTENQGDCNDTNGSIHPNATETCGNGMDDNCNGDQNEENAINCTTYYRDSDGDGYGDTNLTECWCQPGGTTGEFNVTNGNDCFDGNAAASPNQQSYFNTDRGDGSFDYNCDGTQTKEVTVAGSCDGWLSSVGDCTLNTAGWDGSAPACGATGNYLYDNDSCSAGCTVLGVPFCCEVGGPSYSTRVQRCR